MKIAFDVSYIQRRGTGYGRFAFNLIEALLAENSKIDFLLHGWSASLDEAAVRSFHQENASIDIKKIPGPLKRFYWNRISWPPIESVIGQFDIFHSMEPLCPPTSRKVVTTLHDLAYKRFPDFFERNVKRWDPFIARALERSDAVIAPSMCTKNDVCEIFGVPEWNVHAVPYWAHKIFCPGDKSSEMEKALAESGIHTPYLLSVGTLEPRKNLVRLVNAFEQFVRRIDSEIQLVIVGKKGWLYDDTMRAIRSSEASGRIRHVGYVSDQMLAKLYRGAEFFLYPSLFEGFGFPVIEAMASGKAVITSNRSSMKEIAEGAALLVDPESVSDITEAMVLLMDKSKRTQVEKSCYHRSTLFSAKASARKVLDIYHKLMT